MSRWTMGMALVLAASVSVIVPHAEAATRPGPVTALKQQLNGHGGVRQSSVYRSVWGPKKEHSTSRFRAVYKFGGGEVVAVDSNSLKSPSAGASRTIAFPHRTYGQGREPLDELPTGKSWILDTKKNDLYRECGQIRLSDLATLRHVLATTAVERPAGVYDGTRTTLYEGSTTIGELYKLNPSLLVSYFENPQESTRVTANCR